MTTDPTPEPYDERCKRCNVKRNGHSADYEYCPDERGRYPGPNRFTPVPADPAPEPTVRELMNDPSITTDELIRRVEATIAELRQQVAKADTRYNEREAYLEIVIDAFMIQYCEDEEGVAEWAIEAARSARAAAENGGGE